MKTGESYWVELKAAVKDAVQEGFMITFGQDSGESPHEYANEHAHKFTIEDLELIEEGYKLGQRVARRMMKNLDR